MDQELKRLYILLLKEGWTPANQEINPHWWKSIRSDYCYYVELEGPNKMVDHDIYLIKADDQ